MRGGADVPAFRARCRLSVGCLTLDHHHHPTISRFISSTQAAMLVPPNNFGMVEEDLYRSGSPDSINFPFLEMLGLNSLVWLAPEEPSPEL
jgi:tyrosine-protein phosphatase OCA1